MANFIWGGLKKSLDDDETIEQAIARMIKEHEADPEAHLGEGESLQNHKHDSVLDHPAGSVLIDKFSTSSFSYNLFFSDYNKWINEGDNGAFAYEPEINGVRCEIGDFNEYAHIYNNLYYTIGFLGIPLSFRFSCILTEDSNYTDGAFQDLGLGGWSKNNYFSVSFRRKEDGYYIQYLAKNTGLPVYVKVADSLPGIWDSNFFTIDYDKGNDTLSYYINNNLVFSISGYDKNFIFEHNETIRFYAQCFTDGGGLINSIIAPFLAVDLLS